MNWRTECFAAIPCLNESAAVGAVVAGVRQHLDCVLVVDDGSEDSTGAAAQTAGAVVLRHPVTRGKGAALKAGCEWGLRSGFTWALTLDGDGQHVPEDTSAFFRHAEQRPAKLYVGNRMGQAARMPWTRRWVNRWMSWRLSRLAGRGLPDTQCGFRLIHLETWSRLRLTTAHFEIESEALLAFLDAGHGVEFVPIQTIYKAEQSKIHPWHDTLRWLRWWQDVKCLRRPERQPEPILSNAGPGVDFKAQPPVPKVP